MPSLQSNRCTGKSRHKVEDEKTLAAAEALLREKEAVAAAASKKKPLKYPAEDLDVIPTEREKKHGLKMRPSPKRDIPFGPDFESFLMSWSYLEVFGSVRISSARSKL